jgi:hypothetical protein
MVFVSLFSGLCALLPAHGLPAISMAGLPASGVVYPPYSGGQFSVNSLPRQGSGLPKKAPPPTGMVELS